MKPFESDGQETSELFVQSADEQVPTLFHVNGPGVLFLAVCLGGTQI